MLPQQKLKMDSADSFDNLPYAPIVEAVIHWQARAELPWEKESLEKELKSRLNDYPEIKSQYTVQLAVHADISKDTTPPIASRMGGWSGYRLSSPDNLHVAVFTKDGVSFSRMAPYQRWEQFISEGKRMWKVFQELAAPTEIRRMGVRFINRISGATIANLANYLKNPPTCPLELPLQGFLYQSIFDVEKDGLTVKVINAMQKELQINEESAGLILDIDVFTKRPLMCEDDAIEDMLPKIRQLKNGIFFDLVTPSAITQFRGD